tara:strand:+ start:409 stop:5670 length:5262 start_codon:yes stop_codon:yes gene_type:complete
MMARSNLVLLASHTSFRSVLALIIICALYFSDRVYGCSDQYPAYMRTTWENKCLSTGGAEGASTLSECWMSCEEFKGFPNNLGNANVNLIRDVTVYDRTRGMPCSLQGMSTQWSNEDINFERVYLVTDTFTLKAGALSNPLRFSNIHWKDVTIGAVENCFASPDSAVQSIELSGVVFRNVTFDGVNFGGNYEVDPSSTSLGNVKNIILNAVTFESGSFRDVSFNARFRNFTSERSDSDDTLREGVLQIRDVDITGVEGDVPVWENVNFRATDFMTISEMTVSGVAGDTIEPLLWDRVNFLLSPRPEEQTYFRYFPQLLSFLNCQFTNFNWKNSTVHSEIDAVTDGNSNLNDITGISFDTCTFSTVIWDDIDFTAYYNLEVVPDAKYGYSGVKWYNSIFEKFLSNGVRFTTNELPNGEIIRPQFFRGVVLDTLSFDSESVMAEWTIEVSTQFPQTMVSYDAVKQTQGEFGFGLTMKVSQLILSQHISFTFLLEFPISAHLPAEQNCNLTFFLLFLCFQDVTVDFSQFEAWNITTTSSAMASTIADVYWTNVTFAGVEFKNGSDFAIQSDGAVLFDSVFFDDTTIEETVVFKIFSSTLISFVNVEWRASSRILGGLKLECTRLIEVLVDDSSLRELACIEISSSVLQPENFSNFETLASVVYIRKATELSQLLAFEDVLVSLSEGTVIDAPYWEMHMNVEEENELVYGSLPVLGFTGLRIANGVQIGRNTTSIGPMMPSTDTHWIWTCEMSLVTARYAQCFVLNSDVRFAKTLFSWAVVSRVLLPENARRSLHSQTNAIGFHWANDAPIDFFGVVSELIINVEVLIDRPSHLTSQTGNLAPINFVKILNVQSVHDATAVDTISAFRIRTDGYCDFGTNDASRSAVGILLEQTTLPSATDIIEITNNVEIASVYKTMGVSVKNVILPSGSTTDMLKISSSGNLVSRPRSVHPHSGNYWQAVGVFIDDFAVETYVSSFNVMSSGNIDVQTNDQANEVTYIAGIHVNNLDFVHDSLNSEKTNITLEHVSSRITVNVFPNILSPAILAGVYGVEWSTGDFKSNPLQVVMHVTATGLFEVEPPVLSDGGIVGIRIKDIPFSKSGDVPTIDRELHLSSSVIVSAADTESAVDRYGVDLLSCGFYNARSFILDIKTSLPVGSLIDHVIPLSGIRLKENAFQRSEFQLLNVEALQASRVDNNTENRLPFVSVENNLWQQCTVLEGKLHVSGSGGKAFTLPDKPEISLLVIGRSDDFDSLTGLNNFDIIVSDVLVIAGENSAEALIGVNFVHYSNSDSFTNVSITSTLYVNYASNVNVQLTAIKFDMSKIPYESNVVGMGFFTNVSMSGDFVLSGAFTPSNQHYGQVDGALNGAHIVSQAGLFLINTWSNVIINVGSHPESTHPTSILLDSLHIQSAWEDITMSATNSINLVNMVWAFPSNIGGTFRNWHFNVFQKDVVSFEQYGQAIQITNAKVSRSVLQGWIFTAFSRYSEVAAVLDNPSQIRQIYLDFPDLKVNAIFEDITFDAIATGCATGRSAGVDISSIYVAGRDATAFQWNGLRAEVKATVKNSKAYNALTIANFKAENVWGLVQGRGIISKVDISLDIDMTVPECETESSFRSESVIDTTIFVDLDGLQYLSLVEWNIAFTSLNLTGDLTATPSAPGFAAVSIRNFVSGDSFPDVYPEITDFDVTIDNLLLKFLPESFIGIDVRDNSFQNLKIQNCDWLVSSIELAGFLHMTQDIVLGLHLSDISIYTVQISSSIF